MSCFSEKIKDEKLIIELIKKHGLKEFNKLIKQAILEYKDYNKDQKYLNKVLKLK